jgi:tetratricopeptide (TPR) repeat protein
MLDSLSGAASGDGARGNDGDAWPSLSAHAPLLRSGRTLPQDEGQLRLAADWLQHILDANDLKADKVPAWAAFELGLVRAKQRDRKGANEAWRKAMATKDHEYAPRAACFMAVGYQQEGDWDRAREAWQLALDAGNKRYVAAALLGLGTVAQQQGDVDRAFDYWERAIQRRDPEFSGRAAVMLACRHLERGEYAEAEAAFCRVLDIGSDEFRALALLGLGVGNYEQGEFAQAIVYLGAAAESADPTLLPLVQDYRAEALRRERAGVKVAH